MQKLSQKNIEKIILENYIEYQHLFIEFQSEFLLGLYSRYQSVENGNLVLYYAKQTHQNILRQRDYDLNFNLSYDKFWENHQQIKPKKKTIIKVAQDIFLPKETVRRKILQLLKTKVLSTKNKNIGWLPSEQYKKSYNVVVDKEIKGIGRLMSFICEKINLPISKEEATEEIKEKFSFYWFHFLDTQLKYLRLWGKQFDDRELILIFLQVAHLFISKVKKKKLSLQNLYSNSNLIKDFISSSISATSVAHVTGIPRATCIRKLEHLVKLKLISKDKISKRYYIIPEAISESLISNNLTKETVKLFNYFFFVCVRAINVKISNQ